MCNFKNIVTSIHNPGQLKLQTWMENFTTVLFPSEEPSAKNIFQAYVAVYTGVLEKSHFKRFTAQKSCKGQQQTLFCRVATSRHLFAKCGLQHLLISPDDRRGQEMAPAAGIKPYIFFYSLFNICYQI